VNDMGVLGLVAALYMHIQPAGPCSTYLLAHLLVHAGAMPSIYPFAWTLSACLPACLAAAQVTPWVCVS
jgi:hypothetical protein